MVNIRKLCTSNVKKTMHTINQLYYILTKKLCTRIIITTLTAAAPKTMFQAIRSFLFRFPVVNRRVLMHIFVHFCGSNGDVQGQLQKYIRKKIV